MASFPASVSPSQPMLYQGGYRSLAVADINVIERVSDNPTGISDSPLRTVVLSGGPGSERAVSLASGKAVADALRQAGHQVRLADIRPDDLGALDTPADVFFPALHGKFGEDGQLQQIMDSRGLVYCGSGAQACRLSADKQISKKLFTENDLPTAAFDVAQRPEDIARATACWSMPVVVKPLDEGSSIGITIVERADQLAGTIQRTIEQFGPVMVEQYLSGKELTVGILADRALPIIQIKPDGPFYDYNAKYVSETTQYLFDIDIDHDLYERIQAMSVRAAQVLGMRDFCRVEWRLDARGEPYLLEINALPGFTEHSLLPKAAAKVGLPMPRLCDALVRLAMARCESGVATDRRRG